MLPSVLIFGTWYQGCTFSKYMEIFSPMSFSEIFELFPKFMRKSQHFWIHLKFHQNQNPVSNSWDIADIEFLWWWVVCNVIFKSNPVKVMLGWVELDLSLSFDKIKHTQQYSNVSNKTYIEIKYVTILDYIRQQSDTAIFDKYLILP